MPFVHNANRTWHWPWVKSRRKALRHAFHKGDISKVTVNPGESLRLRYGVLLHSELPDTQPYLAAAYQDYLRLTSK